ncbi:MAG: NCS2 family permease [Treponema sp.]|jgi:AGZA family xanthine/uracil permease-like MFS transporter|nr:NCS2 family permease [Treponema sp.]
MEHLFQLKKHQTTVKREVVAGITTFLTMTYILAVNPAMLGEIPGMAKGGIFTATAVASIVATLIMGFLANLPIALAPGMGLNAFFTYTVVFGMGYSWQTALTAVFIEGIIFIILSLFNVRELIIKALPPSLRKSIAVGIGIFIALIGFKNAGIIIANESTLVGLGDIKTGAPLVALLGLLLMVIFFASKVPGSILLGIFITTIIGIPFGVTVVPDNFSAFSVPDPPLFWQFDFSELLSLKFLTVLFTFLFVDIFDTVGTLVGVTTEGKLIKEDGKIPHAKEAFLADAVGTVVGAMLGTSTVTSYVESTSGVAVGGRTGLTSIITAAGFFLALFFSPLFLLIPSAATAPALILVGALMIRSAGTINFSDPSEGIPAFFTIVMMPFSYSIAEGIVFGLLSFVVLKMWTGKFRDISLPTWVLFVIFVLRLVLN